MKNKNKISLRKGTTVVYGTAPFVIRHVNRECTPPLVMLTEKYKSFGKGQRFYIRANKMELVAA